MTYTHVSVGRCTLCGAEIVNDVGHDPACPKIMTPGATARVEYTSDLQSCQNCHYRRNKGGQEQCRAGEPRISMFLVPKQTAMGVQPEVINATSWPEILMTEWCGNWELRHPTDPDGRTPVQSVLAKPVIFGAKQ